MGVREAWIGRSREQQFSRLHLVANNARFAVLAAGRVPNLASRALGLSLRRLSPDARRARPPGAAGGDVRGSVAVGGHVLAGAQRRDAGPQAG